MNRFTQFSTIACACVLFPLSSQAQFMPSDTSPAGDSGDAFGPVGSSIFAPATDPIQNSGLSVRTLFVGRNQDGKTLTVSAQLKNTTEEPVYIALVGPPPAAVDSSGVSYSLSKIGGLASCKTLENKYIDRCIKNAMSYLPGAHFSVLQPGATSIIAATFTAENVSVSGFVSVTMNAVLAKGSRPKDSRDKGDDNMVNVSISFPVAAIPEVK